MEGGHAERNGQIPDQGRRFQLFFVAVCIDARRRGNASFERVADLAGVTSESVRRFERGETWPQKNLEPFAAAYAKIDGLEDARDLFRRALDWWELHGSRPLLPRDERPPAETPLTSVELIEAITRAGGRGRARDEASAPPTSTRRHRAADG